MEQTPWYLNGQLGGRVTVYDGLTFTTVRNAGHMVRCCVCGVCLCLVKYKRCTSGLVFTPFGFTSPHFMRPVSVNRSSPRLFVPLSLLLRSSL